MNTLKDKVKELGHDIQLEWDWDGTPTLNVIAKIPKWDIEEVVLLWEKDNEYHIADPCNPGWDEHFEKDVWTLQEAIEDYLKPAEEDM